MITTTYTFNCLDNRPRLKEAAEYTATLATRSLIVGLYSGTAALVTTVNIVAGAIFPALAWTVTQLVNSQSQKLGKYSDLTKTSCSVIIGSLSSYLITVNLIGPVLTTGKIANGIYLWLLGAGFVSSMN